MRHAFAQAGTRLPARHRHPVPAPGLAPGRLEAVLQGVVFRCFSGTWSKGDQCGERPMATDTYDASPELVHSVIHSFCGYRRRWRCPVLELPFRWPSRRRTISAPRVRAQRHEPHSSPARTPGPAPDAGVGCPQGTFPRPWAGGGNRPCSAAPGPIPRHACPAPGRNVRASVINHRTRYDDDPASVRPG